MSQLSPTASSSSAPAAASQRVDRKRYGMVFDMDACVGCQTCTIACKQSNQTTPGILWRNVLDLEVGQYPDVDRSFLLTGCQHCEQPSCVPVCPTGATYKRADGLVVIDYDVCIGCSSCVVACPYQARKIDKHPPTYYPGERMATEQRPVQLQRVGVAQKCSFCKERVDDGLARGLVPGVDPDATPACANACISQAITFGDFADPASKVSRKLAQQGGRQMHEELGNQPHIFYIGQRRPNDAKPGPLQDNWDWRAAMNFILGGMSSALFMLAWLTHHAGAISSRTLHGTYLLAAGLMGAGLFCVFLKLGRKLRFWRVITRWQTSWMTRETWCVALVFPSVLLGLLAPSPAWDVLVALGAAGFLWCQGKILHTSRGIPAWRHRLVPSLLVTTGLLEGASWLLLVCAVTRSPATLAALAMLAAALWMLRLWPAYASQVRLDSAGQLEALRQPLMLWGHALPALAGAAVLLGVPGAVPLAAASAVLAIIGGAFMKYRLIVKAGHFQGVRIPSGQPVRQSPILGAKT